MTVAQAEYLNFFLSCGQKYFVHEKSLNLTMVITTIVSTADFTITVPMSPLFLLKGQRAKTLKET